MRLPMLTGFLFFMIFRRQIIEYAETAAMAKLIFILIMLPCSIFSQAKSRSIHLHSSEDMEDKVFIHMQDSIYEYKYIGEAGDYLFVLGDSSNRVLQVPKDEIEQIERRYAE
jgi:uncharacterized protein YjiK